MTGFEIALTCLALNVFKEARGEPKKGQMAVALVTLNRARISGRDICEVVFEPHQFSWTLTDSRDGVLLEGKRPNRKSQEWKKAMGSSLEALYSVDFTGGATHYHSSEIRPCWIGDLEPMGHWGSHYFYRPYSPASERRPPDNKPSKRVCPQRLP